MIQGRTRAKSGKDLVTVYKLTMGSLPRIQRGIASHRRRRLEQEGQGKVGQVVLLPMGAAEWNILEGAKYSVQWH
jgi:hypothetical protein